jgi:hypothetical protein
MAIIPIVILNKMIQRFIPDADPEKSSLEILAEVVIQVSIMFCGIVFIHRLITYFPTFSGIKYDNLVLTNVVLAFLMIILSIQTKLGIKINILYDDVMDMWNGETNEYKKKVLKKKTVHYATQQPQYIEPPMVNTPSLPNQKMMQPIQPVKQPDYSNNLNDIVYSTMGMNDPYKQPSSTSSLNVSSVPTTPSYSNTIAEYDAQPMAANSLLGGSFGSSF